MSILLNALEKNKKNTVNGVQADHYIQSEDMMGMASENAVTKSVVIKRVVIVCFVIVCFYIFSRYSILYHEGIHVQDKMQLSEFLGEAEDGSEKKVTSPVDAVSDHWSEQDSAKIMQRLQLEPESLRPDRAKIMATLLDVKQWHVAYALSKALPVSFPSLEERKMLAVHALENDQFKEAHTLYEALCKEDAASAELWIGLGISSLNLGYYKQSEKAFIKALGFMGEDHVAYLYVLNQLDALAGSY